MKKISSFPFFQPFHGCLNSEWNGEFICAFVASEFDKLVEKL